MASLYREKDRGRDGYRLRFRDHLQKQRSLWLGDMSRRTAESVQRHVTELVRARKANVRAETDSIKWAESLQGRIRDRLAEIGLASAVRAARSQDEGRLLGPFLASYITQRTDAKPSTITNYNHAKRWLVDYFGDRKILAEITPADCERWQRYLHDGDKLADSTVEKILKRAKAMFRYATKDRLLEENPFLELKISSSVSRERDAFISKELAAKVLKACPNHDWKVIFGLARFAGMRCPSEILTLSWTDIEWQAGRIRIDSPKTGLRYCPIFEELQPILREAQKASPAKSARCVHGHTGSGKNLRTQLNRIVTNAGLKSWPKTFVNLRASRRTELQELFPDHVVNAWLGHSSRVAEKHYLQVTPEHWAKANGGNTGGNICANPEESAATEKRKIPEKQPPDSDGFPGIFALAPPVGLEPTTRRLTAACSTN